MYSSSVQAPVACAAVLAFFFVVPAEGGSLRGGSAFNINDVESSLLNELAGNFRSIDTKQRLSTLQTDLQPMYKAMPKQSDGTLSHTVVRYMLHRFFAQRHGWFIRGLEPDGDARNSSSATALQEWVPSYLQNFLEELIGGRGLGLKELAILAATIEDLIHKEASTRLEKAYKALQLSLDAKIPQAQVQEILNVYMMVYLSGGNFESNDAERTRLALNYFSENQTKSWGEMQEWLKDLQASVRPAQSGNLLLDFDQILQLVYETAERYGILNDRECGRLKSELLSIEAPKAGRVRLPEFYKKGLAGVFEFNEKVDYLRAIGALDESDPKQAHVIVPNYVASRPNCLLASDFYVVCCRNECEDLMASLERRVGGPTAQRAEVAKAILELQSDTAIAPVTLTDTLLQRLDEIAKINGNSIPLHGRLFAQWMHHVYPQECPYPHISGTTTPQTPDEWMRETGQQDVKASTEEMLEQVNSDTCAIAPGTMQPSPDCERLQNNKDLPWNEVEELLQPTSSISMSATVNKAGTRSRNSSSGIGVLWAGLRAIVIFVMLGTLASGVIWISSPKSTTCKSSCMKSCEFC
mmetsp:Transcript_144102/g.268443  ORF Transcript_144102/g.268443 Transcript_144102/m.268443 type:complete len:581 (-) Transcript_144102:78-1820(-)